MHHWIGDLLVFLFTYITLIDYSRNLIYATHVINHENRDCVDIASPGVNIVYLSLG